jgi:serine/threonine protein kinase
MPANTLSGQEFLNKLAKIRNDQGKLRYMHRRINKGKPQEVISLPQLNDIYLYINSQATLATSIDGLQPNQSLRFAKTTPKPELPITCVIQRFPDRHLELIIMPNRKLADGTKIPKKIQDGSSKKKQDAYRIDDEMALDIHWARLEIELEQSVPGQELMKLADVQQETEIAAALDGAEYSAPIYIGSPFQHIKNGKLVKAIYGFSKLGICNLIDIRSGLSATELAEYAIPNKMPEFLKPIVRSLLAGLCEMESRRIIHIDLDFRNIVLFRNAHGDLYARFIDFANAINLNKGPSGRIGGTFVVMSPDIFSACVGKMAADRSMPIETAIARHHTIYKTREAYGWHVFNEKYANHMRYPEIAHVDTKDSCWSIGTIIFYLLTKRMPRLDVYTRETLAANKLLRGLLAPTRQTRYSAREALACWNENPNLVFKSVPPAEQNGLRAYLDYEVKQREQIRVASSVRTDLQGLIKSGSQLFPGFAANTELELQRTHAMLVANERDRAGLITDMQAELNETLKMLDSLEKSKAVESGFAAPMQNMRALLTRLGEVGNQIAKSAAEVDLGTEATSSNPAAATGATTTPRSQAKPAEPTASGKFQFKPGFLMR